MSKTIIVFSVLLYTVPTYAMELIIPEKELIAGSRSKSNDSSGNRTEHDLIITSDNTAPAMTKQEIKNIFKEYQQMSKDKQINAFLKHIYCDNYSVVKRILHHTKNDKKPELEILCGEKKCVITPVMLTKCTNNQNMAQLLIEKQYTLPSNESWKNYYAKVTEPTLLQEFLSFNDNAPFAFLHYLMATIIDNADFLHTLCDQQLPTKAGILLLASICCENDNIHCFNFLIKNNKTHAIIRKLRNKFYEIAHDCKSFAIEQALKIIYYGENFETDI